MFPETANSWHASQGDNHDDCQSTSPASLHTRVLLTLNVPGIGKLKPLSTLLNQNQRFRSMTATVLLEKQAATNLPLRSQHTSKMPPCPSYVFISDPSCTFQMSSVLSKEPLAKYLHI